MRNIVEASTFDTPVTVLENGDPVDETSDQPTIQSLTNRTKFLNDTKVSKDAAGHVDVTASAGTGITAKGAGTSSGIASTGGDTNGAGVHGTGGLTNGRGLWGTGTGSGEGVAGFGGPTNAPGVAGTGGGSGVGVSGVGGTTDGSAGVQGTSGATNGDGVRGTGSGTGAGIAGTGGGTGGTGVHGTGGAGNGIGVQGNGTGNAPGVMGVASTGGNGIEGTSGGGGTGGVKGNGGSGGVGVWGVAGGTGVLSAGVFGSDNGIGSGAYAGAFVGDVNVNGTLSKSAGAFRIDHPLDPANKYLQHSFVESPEPLNIYAGIVTTDENGDAMIELPDYFEALNYEYRYMLTVVGKRFTRVRVEYEITDNRFAIKSEDPYVCVSWTVLGSRRDPYMRANPIEVVMEKKGRERGRYMHPEAYGLPKSKGIAAKRRKKGE